MIRWVEGFEIALDEPYFARAYTTTGVLNASPNPTGREQGFAARSDGNGDLELETPALSAVSNTWFNGFAVKFVDNPGLPTGTTIFPGLTIKSGGSDQLTIDFVDANQQFGNQVIIKVRRGATVLGTSTVPIISGYWYYIEVKAVVRTGTNGSVEVKMGLLNAVTTDVINVTGINTANTGSDGADRMKLRWSNSGNASHRIDFDDWVVYDNTGALNNNFLGPVSIIGLTPNGTGATMNFTLQGTATSIADAWGDPVASQSTSQDDKKVSADTVGEIALAAYSNTAAYVTSGASILAVCVRTTAAMDSSGTRTIKHQVRDTVAAAEVTGTLAIVLSDTTMRDYEEIFESNPVTTNPWDKAALDGLQVGAKVTA